MLHFVGFVGDEFHRATQIFGQPDFIHRVLDNRALSMFATGDHIVFANRADSKAHSIYSFDDSQYF